MCWGKHGAMPPANAMSAAPANPHASASRGSPWLSLTDLGRLYGLSALQTGRLLQQAGLRQASGSATPQALEQGLALQRPNHRPFWHHQACAAAFEAQGLQPVERQTLISQWAELLCALQLGSPSISTSAEEMARELPGELVEPVNRRLHQLGSPFQVARRRSRGHHQRMTAP